MADAEPVERKPQECIPPGAYSPDGVDRTLIRWMLSMTPGQRLQTLQNAIDWNLSFREIYETAPDHCR